MHTLNLIDSEVFMVVASVSDIDWRLGIVAPVTEMTAQAIPINQAIENGTAAAFWSTLLTIGIFLLVALRGTTFLSRQLMRPIQGLVYATQQMADGNLAIWVPQRGAEDCPGSAQQPCRWKPAHPHRPAPLTLCVFALKQRL